MPRHLTTRALEKCVERQTDDSPPCPLPQHLAPAPPASRAKGASGSERLPQPCKTQCFKRYQWHREGIQGGRQGRDEGWRLQREGRDGVGKVGSSCKSVLVVHWITHYSLHVGLNVCCVGLVLSITWVFIWGTEFQGKSMWKYYRMWVYIYIYINLKYRWSSLYKNSLYEFSLIRNPCFTITCLLLWTWLEFTKFLNPRSARQWHQRCTEGSSMTTP